MKPGAPGEEHDWLQNVCARLWGLPEPLLFHFGPLGSFDILDLFRLWHQHTHLSQRERL